MGKGENEGIKGAYSSLGKYIAFFIVFKENP